MSRITGHKLPQGKTKKEYFHCVGGPYSGHRLLLTPAQGFAGTMTFRANHLHGRYVQKAGSTEVWWQPYAKPA